MSEPWGDESDKVHVADDPDWGPDELDRSGPPEADEPVQASGSLDEILDRMVEATQERVRTFADRIREGLLRYPTRGQWTRQPRTEPIGVARHDAEIDEGVEVDLTPPPTRINSMSISPEWLSQTVVSSGTIMGDRHPEQAAHGIVRGYAMQWDLGDGITGLASGPSACSCVRFTVGSARPMVTRLTSHTVMAIHVEVPLIAPNVGRVALEPGPAVEHAAQAIKGMVTAHEIRWMNAHTDPRHARWCVSVQLHWQTTRSKVDEAGVRAVAEALALPFREVSPPAPPVPRRLW